MMQKDNEVEVPSEVYSIDETDEMLNGLVRQGGRAIKILIGFLLVVMLGLSGAVGYLIQNNTKETARVNTVVAEKTEGLCEFFGLLSPKPLRANSSKVGVELIVDSRNVFQLLDCAGKLPPPSSELIKLAKKYNITIPSGS